MRQFECHQIQDTTNLQLKNTQELYHITIAWQIALDSWYEFHTYEEDLIFLLAASICKTHKCLGPNQTLFANNLQTQYI